MTVESLTGSSMTPRRSRQLVDSGLLSPVRERISVIAEIKRRSPSKGDLHAELDPVSLAQTYESAGASCLSVLTDEQYFGGSVDDLRAARDAVGLPVIRKDFTVDVRDVCDARIMGADCVLLIAAALDDTELADFSCLAFEIGLDVLIEVHDERELERAIVCTKGDLIGVNQRDLITFEVDTDRALRVAAEVPPNAVKVAESGVSGRDAALRLASVGYDALLVGEHLVTAEDPGVALEALRVPR
ncbi:MAG: indole-3-glycerol phosphate synthase TrpC [Microthrixaceae bacterium]